MKRALAVLALVALAAAAAYWFVLRDEVVAPRVRPLALAATIGSGNDAVPVSAGGEVLAWLPLPDGLVLPELPLAEPPPGKRLKGPVREQAEVLGAVPPVLRPYVARSLGGEKGVVVELSSGIELVFGDSSQAARKWKAAAAVLASPSIEALDYVNVTAPGSPSVGGEGHLLPPLP